MTVALCVRCGTFKHGVFNTCNACGFRPVDDHDMAYSLALTDHYFALETLQEIGGAIPAHGRPSLPPEQEKQMLATISTQKVPAAEAPIAMPFRETRVDVGGRPVSPERSRRPSALTATAMVTATETIRPALRTFT